MSITLREARDRILTKLGDTILTPAASRIWSETEIEGYLQDAVRDFSYRTRILWDMDYIDDLPYTGGYNFEWEATDFPVGSIRGGRFDYTCEWERDFVSSQLPAANHTNVDERDDFLITALIAAVEQLPDPVVQLDRVTYDGRRIAAMNSRDLGSEDNYYEITRGTVYGYTQDKDGLRSFRKYKPPNTIATYYWAIGKFGPVRGSASVALAQSAPLNMHIDEWGITIATSIFDAPISVGWDFPPPGAAADIPITVDAITNLTEFGSDTVKGRGFLRRLPGYFPANGPWGLVKKISNPNKNTRIEFFKKAKVPASATDTFDFPDYMVKYLGHYVMAKALGRRGVGQDPTLAEHFDQRYSLCITRTKMRATAVFQSKLNRMGGSGSGGGTKYPPRPYGRLPRNLPSS